MIKIQIQINGVSSLVDRNMLPLDKDGREITKVIDKIVDGKYVVDGEALALELEEYNLQELKQAKADALKSVKVTTAMGNIFDGNEIARGNMTSAILSSEVIGKTEDTWKLADNSELLVTISELKEALALSIQEVGRIVKVKNIEQL